MSDNPNKIGIDLDTLSYSCGVYKSGTVVPIHYGHEISYLPGYLYFNPKSDEVCIGTTGRHYLGRHEDIDVVYDIGRLMGRSYDEASIETAMKHWGFKVLNKKNVPIYDIPHNKTRVELGVCDVLAECLKKIKKYADESTNQSKTAITEAVIAIPETLGKVEKEQVMKSCQIANIKPIELIPESTAAVISYMNSVFEEDPSLSENNKFEKILIYNLGGCTFAVSLYEINYHTKEIKLLKQEGDNNLGSIDLINHVMDYCINLYNKKNKKNPEGVDLSLIRKDCDEAFCLFSDKNNEDIDEYQCTYCFLTEQEGNDSISLKTFNQFGKVRYDRTMAIVDNVLGKIGYDDIASVVLCGHGTGIKAIVDMISNKFRKSKIVDNLDADVMKSIGAAIYANNTEFKYKIIH